VKTARFIVALILSVLIPATFVAPQALAQNTQLSPFGLQTAPSAPQPFALPPVQPNVGPEQQELMRELNEINNSSVDITRVLENHLKKYPNTAQRAEIEKVLAKAAIDLKDDQRTAQWGERVLAVDQTDMLLLDRVARAMLALGGRENAEKALRYAHEFETIVNGLPAAEGNRDASRRQEERDRGLARAVLYQSRAQTVLGQKEEASQSAARAFAIYPDEENAREWGEALTRLGRNEEAITRLADAFAIFDSRATDVDRASDRRELGEVYRKLHGSETGLGDLILASYDRTSALLKARGDRLLALDPNAASSDPMAFSLNGLDGAKLNLSSLKGKVVILDFWATWCGPCRAQHPMYEEVKKRFEGRNDVVFLSIDSDEDRSLVSPFVNEQKWGRTVYFEDGLARLLEVTSIPTTVLFGKDGRVSSRLNGFLPDRFVDQLTERISEALTEPAQIPAR